MRPSITDWQALRAESPRCVSHAWCVSVLHEFKRCWPLFRLHLKWASVRLSQGESGKVSVGPGIYAIEHRTTVLDGIELRTVHYVGKATNLRQRFEQHAKYRLGATASGPLLDHFYRELRKCHPPHDVLFLWAEAPEDRVGQLESEFIKLLDPPYCDRLRLAGGRGELGALQASLDQDETRAL